MTVTLLLSLREAQALRAHLLPEHPLPEVERAKARLEAAIDRVTLTHSAIRFQSEDSDGS